LNTIAIDRKLRRFGQGTAGITWIAAASWGQMGERTGWAESAAIKVFERKANTTGTKRLSRGPLLAPATTPLNRQHQRRRRSSSRLQLIGGWSLNVTPPVVCLINTTTQEHLQQQRPTRLLTQAGPEGQSVTTCRQEQAAAAGSELTV